MSPFLNKDVWRVCRIPFFVLLILFGIFFTTGCREKKVYRIGVSQCSSDDWRAKMNAEIIREMLLHDDAEIEIRSANDNSQKQIEDIRYFADNGFDIIVAAPNEEESLTPVIKEVYEKGIPVILFDRDISEDTYTARIRVDNRKLGESAADYAYHLLGNDIRAIEIYGLRGSTPAEERHKGFEKELAAGNGRILASEAADWLMERATPLTDSLLKIYPDVNLIFAHNDRMAIGAANALRKNGKENVKVIGIDAAPEIGLRAVADSIIDATFLYPTEGHLIVREAIKIVKGEPFEREIILPHSSAVDLSNADILLLQDRMLNEETDKISFLKSKLDGYWEKHSAQNTLFYAIITIMLLLFGLLFVVLRLFWNNRRHQENLLVQNKLLEEERDKQRELNMRLEEATQSKLVFFTNVSHDLRTPLTLIAEPVARLSEANNLNPSQKTLMKIADKNVKILHRLINQILDFRKFENNRLTLNLSEVDLRKLLGEWIESFQGVATKRDITLALKEPADHPESLNIAIDVEKIERVFFNLLSNALKYSPDNSRITVSYRIESDRIILQVVDEGEGISARDLGHIFDRFFQVDRVRPRGSGIGLSLAKAFVELHNGDISVESEPGKGSTFTVTLPLRHVSETAEDLRSGITAEDVESELAEVEGDITFSDDKPLLLVIDDNRDIQEMTGELMKEDYNVITASGGKEGLRKAIRYVPDLIICDVMMPGTDGMEVCRRLKEETATSHIPVLMLTACSLDEQRVQGFESGADGYMAKPFSTQVLKAQAASLIANRARIKNILSQPGGSNAVSPEKNTEKQGSQSKPKPNRQTENDFYDRFLRLFESQIDQTDLSVETLASAMGLERTQFYRKIKALTNYSPVELMRNIRLKRARTLLTSSDMTISEIGYAVGFSTPAYFTKCYRQMFGETPTETRESLT